VTRVTLREVEETSRAVRATASRLEKQAILAALFGRLEADDLALAVSYLAGELPQRRLGVGWKALSAAAPERPPRKGEILSLFDAGPAGTATEEAAAEAAAAPAGELTLAEVDRCFETLARTRGSGSAARATALLRELFRRAGGEGREFLRALLLGELRQGALRAVVRDGVARALGLSPDAIARAEMFGGSLPEVAAEVRRGGPAALDRFGPQPMTPVAPMLARAADTAAQALADLGGAAAETKLDGVRIQLHKQREVVRIFSRRLREVTMSVPELVEVGRELQVSNAILDGEVLALDPAGRPRPFQDTMSRFGQELDPARARQEQPLTVCFFDLLYRDGESLIDRPYAERWQALAELTRGRHLVERKLVQDVGEVEELLARAIAAGHEGLVLKALASPYTAGKRGGQWRKLKPATTLDLVILAAEWGHGRRRGYLSNLHLGARDSQEPGRFWMLGKTFKGLTDDMLRAMTADLLGIAVPGEADSFVVHVRPERVVEIAFDSVQRSPRYDSGLALRFARVKRFRPDKSPEEASTVDEIRGIQAKQAGGGPT
jgi:DNA ligase-1